jgi:hypothetical protein
VRGVPLLPVATRSRLGATRWPRVHVAGERIGHPWIRMALRFSFASFRSALAAGDHAVAARLSSLPLLATANRGRALAARPDDTLQ